MDNQNVANLEDAPLWRLKNYIYFERREEGILFSSGHKTFLIKSPALYPLVLKVISLMDQGVPLPSILNNSPVEARKIISSFVERLASNDMLFDERIFISTKQKYVDDFVHHEDFFKYILENINYSDTKSIGHKFDNWFNLKISLIGDGVILKSVLKNLIACGVRALKVGLPEKNNECYEEIERILKGSNKKFNIEKIRNLHDFHMPGDLTMLCFDDAQSETEVYEFINCFGYSKEHRYMVASLVSGKPIVSPVQDIGTSNYKDLVSRLYRLEGHTNRGDYNPLSLEVLGGVAVLNLITHFFENKQAQNNVVFLEPDMSVSHHFIPPSSKTSSIQLDAELFKENFEAPNDREMNEFELISLRLSPLFDEKIGIFGRSSISHINQVPFAIDAIDIYLPFEKKEENTTIYAWGHKPEQAGIRCLQRSIEYYLKATNPDFAVELVVGFGADDWLLDARSTALCREPLPNLEVRTVNFSSTILEGTEASLLTYQVARQLQGDVSIVVSWIMGFNAFACSIFLDGNCISNATSPFLLGSISNAFGNVYVNFHMHLPLPSVEKLGIHQSIVETIDSLSSFAKFQLDSEDCGNQHEDVFFKEVINKSFLGNICIVGYVEVIKKNVY